MIRALLLALALVVPAQAENGPDSAEADAILAATQRFFTLRGSNPEAALDMVSDGMRATVEDDVLVERWTRMVGQIGEPVTVRILRLTAYPPGEATGPHRLVAVDWQGTFAQAHWGCGYLIWEVEGAMPLLKREESGYVSSAVLEARSAEGRVEIARRLGCAR